MVKVVEVVQEGIFAMMPKPQTKNEALSALVRITLLVANSTHSVVVAGQVAFWTPSTDAASLTFGYYEYLFVSPFGRFVTSLLRV